MINGRAKGSIVEVTLNKSRDVKLTKSKSKQKGKSLKNSKNIKANNIENKGGNFTLGISIWNLHGLKNEKN